ncbi:MAG TPA: hypothetical protein VEU53_11935, partial [Stellaceae bacterium]|nr:hypothetical protein [Stellaceae bacterium]
FGTDHKTDVGFDVQYQYLTDRHSVSAQASWISEHQHLDSTFAQGGSSSLDNDLHSFNAKATYYYDQTYGATLAYSRLQGSGDAGLYNATSPIANSPNSDWWTAEVDYMPFNRGGPEFWPWLNMKLGLQYVWYTKFNGATSNIDGAGRKASDNNTLFAFAWFAF